MRTKKYLRYLSLVVVFSMVFCIISPMATYNAENEEISASEDLPSVEDLPIIEDVRVSEYSITEYSMPEPDTYFPETAIEISESEKLSVYENDTIIIYNYEQLLKICSNTPLTDTDARAETVGKGTPVLNDDGDIVLYRPSSKYRFAHDIALPKHTAWQLPNDFSGSISNGQAKEMPLYDSESDTVYIYNAYQPEVMAMENADSQPILDGDAKSDTFGTGKLIFPNGENKPYLTYSSSHNYVLSKYFSSAVKNSVSVIKKAPALRNIRSTADFDGRDFQGQVIKEIDGETYILIGNEDQLRAIGTDQDVFTPVYQMKRDGVRYVVDTDSNGNPIILYGGDADLLSDQNGYGTYGFHQINDTAGNRYYAGADPETGNVYTNATNVTNNKNSLTEASWKTGEKYTNKANYIVFRDIDLEYRLWTPKMFHGTMTGAKAVQSGETLWNGTEINTDNRPVISHISINQTAPINIDDYCGVGFFATLTPKDGGPETVSVKNIELNEVSVNNSATQITAPETLISGLTSLVGGGVGLAVDTLLYPLTGVHFNLSQALSDLLDAKLNDRSNLATGAFAGRVKGKAEIKNCAVTGSVSVTSVNDRTGGFIGYSDGEEKYDPLSGVLGSLVNLLADVLNIIPGVGLGDLVTILLDNALPVGKIIPIGYDNPVIRNCEVDGLAGGIGQTNTSFNGGFIGQQTGTIIENCEVKNSSYIVQAEKFGGGWLNTKT